MRALLLTLTTCLFILPAQAQYSGGNGTADDPYQIATAEDLIALGEDPNDYDKHFTLTADIDLGPNLPGRKVFDRAVIPRHPITNTNVPPDRRGGQGTPPLTFTGTFYGCGHVISNLRVQGLEYLGLFAVLGPGAEVTNLGLGAVDVNGRGRYIGGLVGYNDDGTISSCYSTGTLRGNYGVGGLVGWNVGSVTTSYSTSLVAELSGGDTCGGLVGSNSGSIADCYSTGPVTAGGNLYVGGLVGFNDATGTIATSYSTGEVNGGEGVGGLVGHNAGTITTSYSTGEVSGDRLVGGLAGVNARNYTLGPASVTDCCSTARVAGTEFVGGLVGYNASDITTSYSIGQVTGEENVGGLVGYNSNSGVIGGSYGTGTVGGSSSVGGLVGRNSGTVTRCYSIGVVSSTGEPVGGLLGCGYIAGWVRVDGAVIDSFWDSETSGHATSAGGMGKTTAEMQTAITFLDADWDFIDETENGPNDIWKIIEGQTYPLLSWQKYGGGTGEPNDPYLIYTAEHLNALGAEPNDWDKHFKLMADIDLSGFIYDAALIAPDVDPDPCEPGLQGTSFTGVFDGNGHAISNLMIDGGSFLGLIGQSQSCTEVRNLGVVDVNITGSEYVGGLMGLNRGSISASYCTGTVSGDKHVGGLTGRNWGAIAASYNAAAVTGNDDVGGLAAVNYGGISDSPNAYGGITDSYNAGTVTADRNVGGLVGKNYGSIATSYSTGTVTGNSAAGGFVGFNWPDRGIVSGFWDIETSGIENSDGGVGKTAAQMQAASTFLEAGWDFVDETANGTENIWWILEGRDYPRLWWEAAEE